MAERPISMWVVFGDQAFNLSQYRSVVRAELADGQIVYHLVPTHKATLADYVQVSEACGKAILEFMRGMHWGIDH